MNCRGRARSLALSLGALGPVLAASCGGLPTEDQVNRDLYGNFETAVASPNRNYAAYWMGREFKAGALTYQGPQANAAAGSGGLGAGIGVNDVDGLQLSYTTTRCCELELTLYSRRAWDRFDPLSPLPGRERKTVYVNGNEAVLWTRYDSPGKVSSQTLIIDYGKTVATVVTGSALPTIVSTPQPDPNPLIDEATFLAVMQNLRPYPQ